MNPSPALGWGLEERQDQLSRLVSDGFLALALMHHLCIAENLQLDMFVAFLRQKGFLVLKNTRSNYTFAWPSLSSQFQMNYHQEGKDRNLGPLRQNMTYHRAKQLCSCVTAQWI